MLPLTQTIRSPSALGDTRVAFCFSLASFIQLSLEKPSNSTAEPFSKSNLLLRNSWAILVISWSQRTIRAGVAQRRTFHESSLAAAKCSWWNNLASGGLRAGYLGREGGGLSPSEGPGQLSAVVIRNAGTRVYPRKWLSKPLHVCKRRLLGFRPYIQSKRYNRSKFS